MASEENATVEVDSQGQAPAGDEGRDRSTIQFPYNDIDDAEKVARAVHEIGGSGDHAQVAGALKVQSNTGAFRYRLQVTRMFGFITYAGGVVSLSPLGAKLCDPKTTKSARAEGFLTVPLYKRVYDEFKSGTLPPSNAGLESAMVRFGVAPKVTDKARQVFQRSAQQAGFFWAGTDRLVMPSGANAPKAEPDANNPPPVDENKTRKGGDGGGGRGQLIDGLIEKLPAEGSDWNMDDRLRWLTLAAGIFEFVYKDSGNGNKSLKVELK